MSVTGAPEDAPTYRQVSRRQYRVTGVRRSAWHNDHVITLVSGSNSTELAVPKTSGLNVDDEVWVTVEVRE